MHQVRFTLGFWLCIHKPSAEAQRQADFFMDKGNTKQTAVKVKEIEYQFPQEILLLVLAANKPLTFRDIFGNYYEIKALYKQKKKV